MKPEFVAVWRREERLFKRVAMAADFWRRFRGLMFYRELPRGIEGLALVSCNSAHTFWMRFPLDLIYLDREGVILRTAEGVKPNRIELVVRGGYFVLETVAGTVSRFQLSVGERLIFK